MRKSEITRNTKETRIKLSLELDGKGRYHIDTQCGFLEHMLELFTRHGRFDIDLSCKGDSHVDFHHTTEDIGICLGQAFKEALGDKKGIKRYGNMILPMDEALVLLSLDISGRACLNYDVDMTADKVGDFDVELTQEFLAALVREMGMTLHVKLLYGTNAHHIIEGIFKGLARALKHAVSIDADAPEEIPSTKGVL